MAKTLSKDEFNLGSLRRVKGVIEKYDIVVIGFSKGLTGGKKK